MKRFLERVIRELSPIVSEYQKNRHLFCGKSYQRSCNLVKRRKDGLSDRKIELGNGGAKYREAK